VKNKPKGAKDCPTCRLIRIFLLLAVPITMMMWFKPEIPLLSQISLTNSFANLVGLALVVVIATKAYQEFWLPYKKKVERAKLEAKENCADADADADNQLAIDNKENKNK
jgi:hypothetical protein